jgi:hypothetical protein
MFMKLECIIKTFGKLNIISALYALVLVIQIQPISNINRIFRITNWSVSAVYILIAMFNLFIFIISTIVFLLITRKYLSQVKLRFLLTLLWIPYYVIITLIYNSFTPIIVRGEGPGPVVGLLFIVIFLSYPFYIAFINLNSSHS